MKEEFDKKLVQKIRQLLDYEEAYQEGAWENFLDKKKKKKRRVLYWYYRVGAAAIIILVSLGLFFWKEGPNDIKGHDVITHTNDSIKWPTKNQNRLEKKNTDFPIEESGVVQKEASQYHEKGADKNATVPIGDKLEKPKSEYVHSDSVETKNFKNRESLSTREKEKSELAHSVKSVDQDSKEKPGIQQPSKKLANPEVESSSIGARVKNDSLIRPETPLDSEEGNTLVAGLLQDADDELPDELMIDKLQLGILLSPNIGSGSDRSQSLASSGLGVGLEVNVPLSGSDFSIVTGAVFNALNFSNEYSTVGQFSTIEETDNRDETKIYSLDIPLNMVYQLSDKFYVQTGLSSFVIFKESTEMTETFERNVEVFHSINGEMESFTTTESVSIKEVSKQEGLRFTPFGTVNLAVGYRSIISKSLKYEVQPFYKYPLKSLSIQDSKAHTVGVALKLIFTK